jgi:two-component system NarL family response regulator
MLSLDPLLCAEAKAGGAAVVLTLAAEPVAQLLAVVGEGVVGMWDREGDPSESLRIVRSALAGDSVVSAGAGAALLEEIRATSDGLRAIDSQRLTVREREILSLLAEGAGNRAIAERLFISENTVKNHVRNVLHKLHAETRTEAVVLAARSGLVRVN